MQANWSWGDGWCHCSLLWLSLPPSLPPRRQHAEKLTIVGSTHTLVLNAERVGHREPLMSSTILGQPPQTKEGKKTSSSAFLL